MHDIDIDTTTTVSPPAPPKRHRTRYIILGIVGAFALLGVGSAIGASGHQQQAARPAPAVTVTQTAKPAAAQPAKPAPTVTVTQTTAPVTVTQTAAPAAPPVLTVAKYSGTGTWTSPQFTINGSSPVVTVKFSYSGNILPGETSGDNFMADLTSGTDSQQIANEIGVAGGKTTTLYPDTSGGNLYHLTVTATGPWSFTITQAG